jgi:integrase
MGDLPVSERSYTASTIQYLTRDQLAKLLSGIKSRRDLAIFTTAYYHGLRASEVGKLQITDWNPAGGRLRLHRVKGGDSFEYQVSQATKRTLTAWVKIRGDQPGPLFPSRRGSRPISRQMLHVLMLRYSEAAGLPKEKSHFHVLRHSVATHMVEAGIPIRQIQDWLGHRHLRSTEIYAKVSPQARDATAELFYKGLEKKPGVNWKKDRRK